jgi:hypothetical protein
MDEKLDATRLPGTGTVEHLSSQPGLREVVVVLGMHRSGTSLCMDVLNQLGIRVCDNLIPADANNMKGYFECPEIVELNDQILGTLGVGWSTLYSVRLEHKWFESPAIAPAREQLIALVKNNATQIPGTWGFKDPRLCVLLPIYEQVFAECGVEPLYVICIRDPRSVALSLMRRDLIPQILSELLWMDNTIRAIEVAGKRMKAVVHYEKWFDGGREQLESLIDGLRLRRNGNDNASGTILEATVARNLDHADHASGRFALACTESIYRLLQNADYATAASEFGEVQRSLRWAMSPGKNTCRLCWRTEGEAFVRTKSSNALTDIDVTRRVVRLPFPAGKLRLTGLRLDPASQSGLARLFTIRVLSSTGIVLWEWDGRVATLEACETRSITFLARSGQSGVIAHFHDGNAAIALPFGGEDVRVPEEGGVLEFEFAWLATSALAGPEFANGVAEEFRAWNAELVHLRAGLDAHASEAEVSSKKLEALAAKNDRLEAELQLAADWRRAAVRSWSWRLTTPLRFVGSFFVR